MDGWMHAWSLRLSKSPFQMFLVSPLERTFPTCSAPNFTGGFFHRWRKYTLTNEQTSTDYTSIRRARSTTQLAKQMPAEVKYCKSLCHLAFVLLKDMNFTEVLNMVYPTSFEVVERRTGKSSGKLFDATNTCLFTQSFILTKAIWAPTYLDRLRELSLDLSKKNRITKFLFYKEWSSQQIWLGQERTSQQMCIGRFTNFKLTVLKAVVDRWRTFGNSAFILCRSLRVWFSMLFNQQSFTEFKFSPTNSLFFSKFGFISVQARSTY